MSFMNYFLFSVVLIPFGIFLMRSAADVRRDLSGHKKRMKAATAGKKRFRVIK